MTIRRIRPRRLVFVVLVLLLVALVGVEAWIAVNWSTQERRTSPRYDPPVLAGQQVAAFCAGGVYARTADDLLVITTTGHCGPAGAAMSEPGGGQFVGYLGPPSGWAACERAGKDRCTSSDMAVVPLVPAMIPWGHLNEIDLGAGGYRRIEEGARPLACADVRTGDRVEMNGRDQYRTGTVLGQQANDFPEDGTYFPCVTVADIEVWSGDSGSVVLVNGIPAGVSSRAYDGHLGFTPLREGLEELGLTLCDTPDCGLTPATAANRLLAPAP